MKLGIFYCYMISVGTYKKSFETNIWNDFHFLVSARNLKAYVLQNLTNILSMKFNFFFSPVSSSLLCGRSLAAFGLKYSNSGTTGGSWIGGVDFAESVNILAFTFWNQLDYF